MSDELRRLREIWQQKNGNYILYSLDLCQGVIYNGLMFRTQETTMNTKEITVRACRNADSYERGWDTEETHIDTVKDAKARAKYFLTEEYRNASEASERLMYAQVVVNGEVMHDYFG